jgi:prepilin-type N-terminal cleavage/methylation domain-containing protein
MTRRAFTLVEVLLALAVVVILISTMSASVNIAWKSKNATDNAIEAVRNTQTLGDVWVHDVSNAVPPNPMSASPDSMAYQVAATQAEADNPGTTGTDTTGQNVTNGGSIVGGLSTISGITAGSFWLFGPFKGNDHAMSFYTTGPEPKSNIEGDVRYVEYELAIQENTHLALIRRVDPNLLAATPSEQLAAEVLVVGVKAVRFRYYDGANWIDSWDTSETGTNNVLPYAVSMELTLEPLRDGLPDRVFTRYATVWCAGKSVNDANYAVAASEAVAATQSNGTGILP